MRFNFYFFKDPHPTEEGKLSGSLFIFEGCLLLEGKASIEVSVASRVHHVMSVSCGTCPKQVA
jgi:hypothetical protein